MATKEIKNPSDDELRRLIERSDEIDRWTIRERVGGASDFEFREHDFEDSPEAVVCIKDIRFDERVLSNLVWIRVTGETVGDILDAEGDKRANLKISRGTKDRLDRLKNDGETWDDLLTSMARTERLRRGGFEGDSDRTGE